MKLKKLDYDFTICKVASIKDLNLDCDFFFIGKTDEEISFVCPTKDMPENMDVESCAALGDVCETPDEACEILGETENLASTAPSETEDLATEAASKTEDLARGLIAREDGWKAFRIQGVLDFSLVGILSKITSILAEHNIGIFAVSTFNTDYILVKAEQFEHALAVLAESSYEID